MKVLAFLINRTSFAPAVGGGTRHAGTEGFRWWHESSRRCRWLVKVLLGWVDVSARNDYDCIAAQDLFNSQALTPSIPATLPAEGKMRKRPPYSLKRNRGGSRLPSNWTEVGMALAGIRTSMCFMKPSCCRLVLVLAGLVAVAATPATQADTKENPFQRIVDRNPFGLKPATPQTETNTPPVIVPPAKVTLTGITSLFGSSSKRVFLEIVEQEPGKPPVAKKPILREGERDGSVEVLSIDVEKSVVRIRNGGQESNITFEVAKASPTPTPAPGPAGFSAPPTASTFPGAHNPIGQGGPMIIGGNANPTQGQGVTLMSGGASPATGAGTTGVSPTPGNMANFGGAAGVPGYGGAAAAPSAFGYGGGGGGGASVTDSAVRAGLGNLPTRQIRTDATQTGGAKQISREESYIQMELQRQLHERAREGGRQFPPLPPTPLTPQVQPVQ